MWWNSPVGLDFRKLLEENLNKLAHGTMNMATVRDQVESAEKLGEYTATRFYWTLTYEQLVGE